MKNLINNRPVLFFVFVRFDIHSVSVAFKLANPFYICFYLTLIVWHVLCRKRDLPFGHKKSWTYEIYKSSGLDFKKYEKHLVNNLIWFYFCCFIDHWILSSSFINAFYQKENILVNIKTCDAVIPLFFQC